MVSSISVNSTSSEQKSIETDLFLKPYAQDDLISLTSVDEMAGLSESAENDLLRPIFDAIDTEHNNYITLDKFFEEMDRYSHTPTSAKKKEKLQKTLDPDNQGIVTYPNFVTGVLMFRLENSESALSPEDEIGYDQLVNQWSVHANNGDTVSQLDETSSGATNWSTNGGMESPEDLSNDFEQTLTVKDSHKNMLKPNQANTHRSHSLNDKFRGQELPGYQNQNGRASRNLDRLGTPDVDYSNDKEDIWSNYSDMEDNLSVSSAHNTSYRYGHRRNNSNMSSFSRSPRPRSPGGNSAADDACSHLSESDAYMLDHKIRALQQQLENYVTGRAESDATQLKLREDKSILQNRALMLEEQLSEVKRHHEDEVLQLKQNHREERQHLEREARERVEQLRDQMRDMEQNSHQLKSQVPRLTGQLELLKEDKQKLEDKLDSKEAVIGQLELKLAKLEEEKNRLEQQHQWKISSLQSDHNQLLKELELKNSSSSRSSSRQGHVTRGASFGDEGGVGSGEDARVTDLVHKCNLLRNENSRLIEKIHELESSYRYLESQKSLCENCQLPVAASSRPSSNNGRPTQHSGAVGSLESLDLIQGDGQSPLTCPRTPPVKGHSDGNHSMSLAAELEQVFNKPREIDVNEVVKAALEQNKSYQTICFELKQQEQINSDLQNYLSRLLLLIMESNPEILEVK